MALVRLTDNGLYCPAGDFYIDPWRPVEKAVITHGHSDHAREGNATYICATASVAILKQRVGQSSDICGYGYRETFNLKDTKVSLHPAGHILGSAQVRIEHDGEVLVVSGDYKRNEDPTCEGFEVVPCDTFVTEATFGLPIYQWPNTAAVAKDIVAWCDKNTAQNKASVLFCYSLGKAQRLLAELAQITDRTVYIHGAVQPLTTIYREAGIKMLPTQLVSETAKDKKYAGELILAPPSADGGAWLKRFGDYESAFASGWMRVRGARRWKAYDRGFVVSDHADWNGLLKTVKQTGAKNVFVTHGNTHSLVRHLNEQNIKTESLETLFGSEEGE